MLLLSFVCKVALQRFIAAGIDRTQSWTVILKYFEESMLGTESLIVWFIALGLVFWWEVAEKRGFKFILMFPLEFWRYAFCSSTLKILLHTDEFSAVSRVCTFKQQIHRFDVLKMEKKNEIPHILSWIILQTKSEHKCKLQKLQRRVSGFYLFREKENKLNITHNSACFH